MKRKLFIFGLCAVFILCTSGTALAKLFIVVIDGQRVVVDFYVPAEQEWQIPLPPDYAIHEYDFKIWYPHLEDTFDMTLKQQEAWIWRLKYAGIQNWRIGYYWDTVPLKASLFGGISGLGPNFHFGINSSVYFPYTASGIMPEGTIGYLTLARTGNELGDPDIGGNGAMIEAGGDFGFPAENYPTDGRLVPGREDLYVYYTLIPSHAQDHWASPMPGMNVYDDDINCTPDYLSHGIWPGWPPINCGAWTVSEYMPEIWPPKGQFHEIKISDVVHPAGDLIPVAIVSVMQDEPVFKTRSRVDYMKTSPDAIVDATDEAAIVYLRAERSRSRREDGRVYHITFEDMDGNTFTLKIGVPKVREYKWSILVDGGPLYDSTVIE